MKKQALALAILGFVSIGNVDAVLAHEPRPDDRREYRADHHREHDRRHEKSWRRGDRYDGPRVYVTDYRRYDLPPPPDRHHRWVRDEHGDFILIAVATGVITDLLLHSGD